MIITRLFKCRIFYVPTHALLFFRRGSPEKKASYSNMTPCDNIEKRYEITKSPNDKRLYRGLLLSNKMKVLLISDSTTDKSAAAMGVNIGYMNDPDDLPGLAHFCEHMLFLGTEKYPKENDYNMFLSQNGGVSNAVTYMDYTNYYFDVAPEKLEDALDRFAQFFIKPLFTESLTELELNALHSEHLKNLVNDIWRIQQVDKSSADPNHPYSKFCTGSKETLDIIPKQKGINVRERLLEFYEKYYSANVMALCVLGKESLDDLEKIVINLFSHVKNKGVELPIITEHPFNEEHFQTKWYVVPIKDIRSLRMVFPLPDLQKHYRAAPVHYISHLLGHEGEGSLLSALKARNWCNSLIAGKPVCAKGFMFLHIIVDWTEEGFNHIDDIIELTFSYINMLKKEKPVEWIYQEYRDIAAMNFQFKEKISPRMYVSSLVGNLHDYPIEEVLIAECLFPEWNPELITQVMGYLVPQNIRVRIVGKTFESIADETEKWYGTKFKKEKIPPEIIDKWANAKINSDLKLPLKNEFIPTKFHIKTPQPDLDKFPIIIKNTQLVRAWFKQDDEFLIPKANLTFDFISPIAHIDPINCNLLNMFLHLVLDSLTEYAYSANLADLKWDIQSNKYGFLLGIRGYDHKQKVLLEKIMDRIVTFEVQPKRFEIWKECYIRMLQNFKTEQPHSHAIYYLGILLSEQVWDKDELLEACSYLTVEKLQEFIPQFLSKLYIESLIHGNITMSEAIDMIHIVESKLTNKTPNMVPLLPKHMLLSREIKLEDGCHFLYETENHFHKSSCTEVYYQTGLQSTESNMLLQLLTQIISEPCFNILRTKEQLGYIVFSGIKRTNDVQGLKVLIQSHKHPKYVETRIDKFMDTMLDHISTMSEEEFNRHKESLAIQLLQKPKTLIHLSSDFWREITSQQYNFDRANIEVAYLRTITQQQILQFFKEVVFDETRRKLSVHVISMAEDGAGLMTENTDVNINEKDDYLKSATNKSIKKIDDIMSFKNSQHLYPLLKPFINISRKGTQSSKL